MSENTTSPASGAMSDAERLQTLVTARLLAEGRSLDALGIGLTVAAALVLFAGTDLATPAIGTVLMGLVAKYLGTRVAFDARLFADASSRGLSTAAFDDAMRALGLLPDEKAGRDWTARCRSARQLLTLQAVAVALQCAFALVAAWAGWGWTST